MIVSMIETYEDKFPKNPITTFSIRLLLILGVILLGFLILNEHYSFNAPFDIHAGCLFMIVLGLGMFLDLVVDNWQTRRVLILKSGHVDYYTEPKKYIGLLMFYALLAMASVLFGVIKLLVI